MTKRSPYEYDGAVSVAANVQRIRKKKRHESSSIDAETASNNAWLASMLHPTLQTASVTTEERSKTSDVARDPPEAVEKRLPQAQTQMSVEALEQKKMLLPYLDKIEYINCQLRQRGLLPAEDEVAVKDDRTRGATMTINSPVSRATRDKTMSKSPSRVLPNSLARNQDEQDSGEKNAPAVNISSRMLRTRYPRLFGAIEQSGTKKMLILRDRGINWLLKMVESVYNALSDVMLKVESILDDTEDTRSDSARTASKSTTKTHVRTPGRLAMPHFTRRFIHHSLGLPDLADQECMDLMYNIELVREQFPQVTLFASFLREILDEDTLLFFLFVRHHLQAEFDLDLVAKEKQAHSSGSKKYIASNMLELRYHPLIPDGTKQVFLSKAACECVMQRVFDFSRHIRTVSATRIAAPTLLAQYTVRELVVTRLQIGNGHFMVSAEVFLTTLVNLFGEIAEDILAQFKFNDDGESLSSLIRLRDTITLDSKVDKWVALYADEERVLRNQKIELMKMQRSNTNNQFRIQIRLLENQIRLQEQELQHIQKKITDGENLVNNVWNEVVAVKSHPKKSNTAKTGASSEIIEASKDLVSVLGRFEAHFARLQKKHDIAVKASMLLAVPWQQQMEELRLRMVIRVQRAYRASKRAQEIKQKAREKLSAQIREREIKLKNQELERKRLEAVREKGMERHMQRLKATKEQEAKQKRQLEEKQKKLVLKAREEEATQRAAAAKKKELVRVMTQWKFFVVMKKNRRKANLLFLKFKLMKWKLQLDLSKKMNSAARTIQNFVRRQKQQAKLRKFMNLRVKRTKMAKKYLLKVQSRMVNRLFNQWVAFTFQQQKLRENFVTIIQKREGNWFQRWIRYVEMWKSLKAESAVLIQRQYRGRVGRRVFRLQRDRHCNSITIQRVYRGYRGRSFVTKRRNIKAFQDNGVEAIRHRISYRQAGICFDMLSLFTRWERRIKEMARTRRLANQKKVLAAWGIFVELRKKKRAARLRLHNSSALVIQRNFLRHRCQQLFQETLRSYRAAVMIQRIFRGYLDRQAVMRYRWEMYSALRVQTVWRRHKAMRYVAAVRTEKILLATYKGDYTTVKRAIANGFWHVMDSDGNSILHIAAAAGYKRIVKLCLRNSFDINLVNSHSQTPLHLLLANLPPPAAYLDASDARSRDERIALAEYMIEHGAWHEAPDEEGFTPLLQCSSLGQSEAVDMLINHGANTEVRTSGGNLNAAQLAVEGNYSSTLKILLESGGFDTGETGQTTHFLLHACSGRGLVDCARVLVDHIQQRQGSFGNDALNARDAEGNTPLIYAVSNGNVDITEYLLAAGAGPDVKDYFGRSPLHFALLCNDASTRETLVNVLIQYDADVSMKDTDGDAPLHVSCAMDERLTCTLLLLTNGAAICANAIGNHPTHIAARNGAVETLRILLDYGGDMNLKNYEGKTPLGIARMYDQQAVIQFVSGYFAEEDAPSVADKDKEKATPLLDEVENNQDEHEGPEGPQNDDGNSYIHPDVEETGAEETSQKPRKTAEWAAASTEAYCMGTIAEWTQYIDASTEMPFYYSTGPSGEHVYTWDSPVEFDAAMGEAWEIVRGPTTAAAASVMLDDAEDELTSAVPPINYALLQDVVQNSKRMKLLRARIRKISAEELSASAMEYMRFFQGFEAESAQMRAEMRAAIKIQRHFRSRRTRLLVKTLLHQNRCAVDLQRAFRGRKARREADLRRRQQIEVVKIQAAIRGYLARKREDRGLRAPRQLHLKRRLAAREIQRTFRGSLGRKRSYREKVIQRLGPKGYFEWEALRKQAQIVRSYKVWDEMEARSQFPGVHLYRHQLTGVCSWEKPSPWVNHDREAFENRVHLAQWGYTERMQKAARSLQAIWRARAARISFRLILRAVQLMKTCESEYLEDPTNLVKMGNYVLYLHTILHDYDRARPLYGRLMRVMGQRGPDLPFILFSYGIFLYVTQEEDVTLVEEMIIRGKIADPTLVKYKVAFLGFFRQATLQNPDDAETHINYAACVQWLYEQYDEATTHYLLALAAAPQRKGTMEMFQDMLDRRRRIERAKLTPRSRKAMSKMEDAGVEEQYDAFARFRRWQVKQAEDDDRVRRLALEAEQNAAERLQAARKIQARYRRRNATHKVTRLRLEYKVAAAKAEEAQQQALYDRVGAAFEDVDTNSKKTKKGALAPSFPISQLDAIFMALHMDFTEPQLRAVSAKFRKDHPKLKHVTVMDICRFIQAQPALQEKMTTAQMTATTSQDMTAT
ncbi:hypothetical protein PHYBOEH_002347 [Phytophthora boehmeriae]|uniref:Ankyrin repeat-containing domain n=1 Tax=Phytophthora boehmeriae TaxID=109152 RepID=A0A8T1WSD1_9STRA|nr:hypothetical protein PHYBOEH_002347 [Phytophthora boehmeriae]